jgi:hypothetical protein
VVFSTSHQPVQASLLYRRRDHRLTPPSESAKAGDTQGGLREASRRRVPVSSDERAILYSGDDRLGGACYKSVNLNVNRAVRGVRVTLDDDVERCDPSVRSLYFSERSTPSRSRGDSATT